MITTNLDINRLNSIETIAKELYVWTADRSHPEHYSQLADLTAVRNFVYVLDLLETELTRFAISAHIGRIALDQLENNLHPNSLGWEFWQIDIEEFFATSLLELCNQLSNIWKRLDTFGGQNAAFAILKKQHQKPSDILIARHKASHCTPHEFEEHDIAQKYSILRAPYKIENGSLVKELAKFTMPRVAALIRDSVDEGLVYLQSFRRATIG